MPPKTIEERMTELEQKVASLLEGTAETPKPDSWLDKWFGAFKDDPYFDEAVRLGAEYRSSQPTGAEVWDAQEAERLKAEKNGTNALPA